MDFIKGLLFLLFAAFAGLIAFFGVCVIFGSIYIPLKLSMTGREKIAVVTSSRLVMAHSRNGVELPVRWKIHCSGIPYPIQGGLFLDEDNIRIGKRIKVLYDDRIQKAVYVYGESRNVIMVLLSYTGIILLVFIAFFVQIVLFVKLYIHSIYMPIYSHLVVKIREFPQRNYSFYFTIIREIMPCFISIVLIWIVTYFLFKGILSVEDWGIIDNENAELVLGFAFLVCLLIFNLAPRLLIKPVLLLSGEPNTTIKFLKELVKVSVEIFFIYKILRFLIEKDLTKFDNFKDLLMELGSQILDI
ncbi:hypothetical protein [Runella sp.]|uniref:hypothetical protein n=1 Tax=Runella sp. TaxID=1960881 RepID=UPI003D0E8842